MLDRMELRHLRYFVAVAEAENVTRAALKLHVSQPALSRQIRDLEDELGFALLQRDGKSVRLTEAGRTFLSESRAVLQRAEEAIASARATATGGGGELHVGYAPSLTARILPPALRSFQAAFPKVRVKLHDLSTEEMLTQLRQEKLHLAFLVRPTAAMLRGLRFAEVAREQMRLAVAPGHPFARRRNIAIAEAVREPFIAYSRQQYPEYHQRLAALFSSIKGKPRIAEEHDSVSSLITAVEAGIGIAYVSESLSCLVGPRLKLLPLSPAPDPLVVGAAWPKKGLNPAAEHFLQSAKASVGDDVRRL
jgi:DNA-binding transcriptional LysR family regulator